MRNRPTRAYGTKVRSSSGRPSAICPVRVEDFAAFAPHGFASPGPSEPVGAQALVVSGGRWLWHKLDRCAGGLPRLDQPVCEQAADCGHDVAFIDQCEPVWSDFAVVTQALTLSKSSARPSRTRSGKGGMSTRTSLRTRSRMEAHASVSARLPEAPAWDDQRSSRSAAARRSLRLDEAGADDPQAGALGARQSRQI